MSGVSPTKPLLCPVCGEVSAQSCRACMKVNYCGREHQKSHWKSHKGDCFPARLAYDEKVGRHLVATRNIQQGEVIFREKPLVSGPLGKPDSTPVCLTCFKSVVNERACSSCSWPVCSEKCEKSPQHTNFECEIFKRKRLPAVRSGVNLYEKIIVLRGVLLKEKDPGAWSKVLELQDHSDLRKGEAQSSLMLDLTVKFIRGACGLTQVQESEIDHVLGSVVTNAFVSDDSVSSGESFRNGTYLFYLASMPAHDCTPNSSWVIQANSEFCTRASVDIRAGDSITQLYGQPTAGTQERRLHLRKSKYFDCTCQRCSDPTELGTFFSSVKCPGCPEGYLLLEDPLRESTVWKCNNAKNCSRVTPQNFVEDVIKRIQEDPQLVENSTEETRSGYLKSVGIIERLLKKHQGKTVHPNHYSLHTLENDLLQRISFILSSNYIENEQEKVELAQKMVALARKCVQIADIIWPGYTRHRGRLLYFLQQALLVPLKRTATQKRTKKLSPEKIKELKSTFQEVLSVREMVYKILSIEPEGREESFIASMMKDDKSDDIQIVKTFLKI